MWSFHESAMAAGKTAVLARMEQLYCEYNQLSRFLRAIPDSEGAADLSLIYTLVLVALIFPQ